MGWHLTTIQRHQVEISAEATNRDASTFTAVPVDSNTGNSLQCFCEVRIGEVTDVLSGDRVHNTCCVSLGVHRALQARTDTCDYDFFHYLIISVFALLRSDWCSSNRAQRNRHCERYAFFSKQVTIHVWSNPD